MDWSPPLACVNDHALEYPNVLVSWVPCDCAKAGDQAPTGHQTVKCRTCGSVWYQGGCDKA